MRFLTRHAAPLRLLTPLLFCSISVLVRGQAFAGTPTVSLNADAERDNIAESGRLGYVGGSTRVGVSIDKNMQGQVDLNQIIAEDDTSATSAEGWFGYQLKDKNGVAKGINGGGVKLNHLWVDSATKAQSETVHKVFGAYDKNADDHAKVTAGYGQEQKNLFWAGHLSKGISDKQTNATGLATKAYDYGVGGEVGTFLEDSLTRLRGGVDYEWGTDQADSEDTPTQATISAGVQQYFYDSPHSITFDVSASQTSGGASNKDNTASNARLGYQYEFADEGTFQSDHQVKRTRVEIPGTAAIAAIPAIPSTPAQYTKQAIKKPYTKLVKTTMKLENETFFKLNSSKLTSSAQENLSKIAAEIRRNQYTGAIRITGNTCGLGNAKYDQRLSARRAKTVKKFLINEGFNPDDLIARGLGKGHPKYRNEPASGFKNRRVDIEYVTQRSAKKTMYKTEYKNVLVSAATAEVPGTTGVAAVPARFIWKTEEIKTAPLWIKRALHNPIRHKRPVDTYQTQSVAPALPVDDYYTLKQRDSLLDVLANDAAGLTLNQIISAPAHGTATVVNSKVRYVVDTGYVGNDQFSYEVKDANGTLHTAVVHIIVPENIDNVAPVAVDDTLTINVDTAITHDIVANDSDADRDTLVLATVSTPSYGTVSKNGNKITYTPNKGFIGTDTFTYTIFDGKGHEATATVTIHVNAGTNNQPPKALNDTFTTEINSAKTYDVISNDSDPDKDTLTITSTSTPSNGGTVEIISNKIKYTPATDYSGTDSFTYIISDGQGHTATASVKVTINAAADSGRPILSPNYAATYGEVPIMIRVLADDTDPDGDTLVLTRISTAPNSGTATIVNDEVKYQANSGYIGSDSFYYEVTDNNGHTLSEKVTIDVKQPNTPPNAVFDRVLLDTSQSRNLTINVIANDTDADGDSLTVVAVGTPNNGKAIIAQNRIIYTADTDFNGFDTFSYTISDNKGNHVTGYISVTVSPHVGASDDYIYPTADTTLTTDVISNDGDIEGHDLTVCEIVTQPEKGTVTASGDEISFTPNSGATGSDTFDYKVCDSKGQSDIATVYVTIGGTANQAPVLTNDTYGVNSGSSTEFNVLANDSDPDGDTLLLEWIATQPNYGYVKIKAGKIIYLANNNYEGTDTFSYTVTDGFGHYQTASVTVTVTSVENIAPVIDTLPPFNVKKGEESTLDLTDFVNDANGDSLYIAAADALSGSLTFRGLMIKYTPIEAASGSSDSIQIEVRDGQGGIARATIIVNIRDN
jgi:outer membrane protein OmpA-like peptidoglycan-associated protein